LPNPKNFGIFIPGWCLFMSRKPGKRSDRENQKRQRRRSGEKVYLFDRSVAQCLAEFSREEWELAIDLEGGNVAAAARFCGFPEAPAGCKALWGATAAEAQGAYRSWLKRQGKP
jgi:hypothetical protein